jgi:hypothetical protein
MDVSILNKAKISSRSVTVAAESVYCFSDGEISGPLACKIDRSEATDVTVTDERAAIFVMEGARRQRDFGRGLIEKLARTSGYAPNFVAGPLGAASEINVYADV